MIQALISGSLLAGILLYLGQITVNTKDLQKKHENKLLFRKEVRFMNEMMKKPLSCRCIFSNVLVQEGKDSPLQGMRLFKDADCKTVVKVYPFIKASLKEIQISKELEATAVLELHSKLKDKLTSTPLQYRKTMKFKVSPDKSNAYAISSCL